MSKKVKIGEFSVDSGLVWIGDPCYILHQKISPKEIGKNWEEFCEKLGNKDYIQFNHDKGYTGLGVCASTGYGDGLYDVMAEIKNKRIKSISIKFF